MACAPRNVGTNSIGVSVVQPPDHPQHLQFIVHRQPVAGLRLDGCRASFQKPGSVFLRLRQQFFLGRSPRFPHGRANATAALGDLFIRRALRSHLELVHPIAGKHGMRVRIDKPGQHDLAPGIDHFSHPLATPFDFRRRPGFTIRPSSMSIAPSGMMPSSRISPPTRGRFGPASVTSWAA